MNRWILQMGFPVVTIDTQTGSISQQHFLIDPEAADSVMTSDYKYVYPDNICSDSCPIASELALCVSSKIIAVTNGLCQSPG